MFNSSSSSSSSVSSLKSSCCYSCADPEVLKIFEDIGCTYITANIIPHDLKINTGLKSDQCNCVAISGKKCIDTSCANFRSLTDCPRSCGSSCGNQVLLFLETFCIFYLTTLAFIRTLPKKILP